MRATVVIEDNPDGRTVNVDFRFEPQLHRLAPGEEPSPARLMTERIFALIKGQPVKPVRTMIAREEYYGRSA